MFVCVVLVFQLYLSIATYLNKCQGLLLFLLLLLVSRLLFEIFCLIAIYVVLT